MQKVETNLHHFYADTALPKLSNQYVCFGNMKIFFLLSLPDKVLLINKILLLVPPKVDERENWISEQLMLVKMDIVPCLLTDLWSANISIDISSWLFHPFLENIRESVKCQFVGKLFIYTHSERFYFLDKTVTAVSVYQFDIAFSNEIQSKFWTSGKCGDFCPDRHWPNRPGCK